MSRALSGFNFFAHVTGNFGLAVAARATLAWLLAERRAVCLRDVETHDARTGQDHTYDRHLTRRPWGLPFGVNLFHLNPPELDAHLASTWQLLPIERRLNVTVPFWELTSLPPLWRRVLASMDLVLAPTRFVQDIVSSSLPDVPCLHLPIVIDPAAPPRPDRARFGLPEGVVFLAAFDVASDIERKNPWAAIEAFRAAFAGGEPAHLVVKLSNSHIVPEARPPLERLHRLAAEDPRIVIVDQQLSRADLHALYSSCDVFVSLHRAEGLGLILMETMSLGKAVLATGWSGNMDFTTEDNACLVDYDMVPVQATHLAYREESARTAAHWAEPRIATAAAWMRRLNAEPELRARLGGQAARDMRLRVERERRGKLAEIDRVLALPSTRAGHARRARGLLQRRIDGLSHALRSSPRVFVDRLRAVARKAFDCGSPQ